MSVKAPPHVHVANPRAYHRRANELIDWATGNVYTVCGAVLNYQQTMGSWDDIDCCCCLALEPAARVFLGSSLTKGYP